MATRETSRNTCRWSHDWSKWGEVQTGKKLWRGEQVGDLWFQERTCQRCGMVDVREVLS